MMQIDDNDYVAVICEGSSEVTVINMLLDGGHLCFGRDQLISEDVLPSTYFRNPTAICRSIPNNGLCGCENSCISYSGSERCPL